jgi:mRNA interferase MazF
VLDAILVALVTRTVRGISTEVALGPDDGLPADRVAAFDATTVFPRAMLVRRMGALAPTRTHELCDALAAATDR